jgi:hypothetical protein
VEDAADCFDAAISSPITINIEIGYGEYGGTAIPGGALGETTMVNVEGGEGKALGLTLATGPEIAVAIGFELDPNDNIFTYNPNDHVIRMTVPSSARSISSPSLRPKSATRWAASRSPASPHPQTCIISLPRPPS